MLYPPMTTIQLVESYYNIKTNKYQAAVLYLHCRLVSKFGFIFSIGTITSFTINIKLLVKVLKNNSATLRVTGTPCGYFDVSQQPSRRGLPFYADVLSDVCIDPPTTGQGCRFPTRIVKGACAPARRPAWGNCAFRVAGPLAQPSRRRKKGREPRLPPRGRWGQSSSA